VVRIISTTGLIFAPDDVQTRRGLQRPDCVAGHVRFELRNVVANYAFEKSRRFAGNQPNSGHGDHSRLSCGAGDTQLGPVASRALAHTLVQR